MVSPILVFAVTLAAAFLLPLFRKIGSLWVDIVSYGVLAFAAIAPATFLPALLEGGAAVRVDTAGVSAPLSIRLTLGLTEAVVVTLVNLTAIGSLIALSPALRHRRSRSDAGGHALFLLMIMGATGIVMTRDAFNMFVFLEIMSIATYGLLVVGRKRTGLQAAFKYIVAGGLGSAFFLIGIILLYRSTGTLNLDGMIAAGNSGSLVMFTGAFLLLAAVLVELKPFPANGWALDVYQAAHPALAAVISASTATAVIVVLHKVSPLFSNELLSLTAWVGVGTFFASNLMGLKQTDERRMLGYSSVAQIGLITFVVAEATRNGWDQPTVYLVAGGLLVNHLAAKAGLFWSVGPLRAGGGAAPHRATRGGRSASVRAQIGFSFVAASVFVTALIGLPPFPAFWAKWRLVHLLASEAAPAALVLILAGSLFEAVYLLRWLVQRRPAEASDDRSVESSAPTAGHDEAGRHPRGAVILAAAGLFAAGAYAGALLGFDNPVYWLPVIAVPVLLLLDFFPVRFGAVVSLAALAAFAVFTFGSVSGVRLIFTSVFVVGGAVSLVSLMHRRNPAPGLAPMILGTVGSLVGVALARTGLEFFFSWEVMTVCTFFLVLRAPRGKDGALRYAGFSLGGALAVLAGLALLVAGGSDGADGSLNGSIAGIDIAGWFAAIAHGESVRPGGSLWGLLLIVVGVLTKAAAVGLHLWLPETYADTDDEASTLFSAAVSKAAVFALIIVAVIAGAAMNGAVAPQADGTAVAAGSSGFAGIAPASQVIGWIGIATAVFGALLAAFQEDAKHLLAYSSMSQVGYMILGISLMTHLGWVSGLYLTVLHAVFKGMLFLAIAGIIKRTGTSKMYELGGLIKRMPLSFISVLMAIIAVSGVPPLAGFGGKWLLYTALLEKGWYLQAGVVFFAGAVAFLYLFRLIHTIFLGQLKDSFRSVKEAPLAILVPQLILIGALMGISMFPSVLLKPLMSAVEPVFASSVEWQAYTVISTLGYWNGNLVMYVTFGVFALPLIWLMVVMRRPQHVEQFNIVYAAERPERPETTHFAHNFYAPYRKALGFLVTPVLRRLWSGVIGGITATGGALRRIYTGNGQTYALHIVLFVVILFVLAGGLS